MDLVKKARAKLMIGHPFWATLLMSLDAVEDNTIPTLATDMRKIYYNREFVESLGSVGLVMSAFAHEVSHVAFEDGLRVKQQGRNHLLWNIAADFKRNQMLEESGFELGQGWLRDEKYDQMSVDQVYIELQKQVDKARKDGKSGKPGEGGIPGPDGMHGPEGDLKQPDEMSPAAEAETRRKIQQNVAQAANVARMAGKLSGELERFVTEILDPKVPWAVLLREYMTRTSTDDESWAKRNRRFSNVYLPARFSERMGPIIGIGDTSGSIGNDELKQYGGETMSIVEDVRPESFRFLWADTKVAGEQLFEEGDEVKFEPKGGGGTDMRVPLKYAEQYDPEVVILFTDGYTPWPTEEPPYTLIVCCTTNADCPVGQVIRI